MDFPIIVMDLELTLIEYKYSVNVRAISDENTNRYVCISHIHISASFSVYICMHEQMCVCAKT